MAEQDKSKRKRNRKKKMTLPQTKKPTLRQRRQFHKRADTLLGSIDQAMNPGMILRDPDKGRRYDDRVVPALSEVLLGTGRFVGDKIKGMRGMSAGGSLKTKGIDGIAKRGKTRAKRG